MPFTPFHFGPAALVHAAAPRSVSFLAFCATNVLIDAEVAVNLAMRNDRLHTFLHTYLGATLVILVTIAGFLIARMLAAKFLPQHLRQYANLSTLSIILGAVIGACSHILLDSFMHRDMHPLAPFSDTNHLLDVIPLRPLHLFCVITGAGGIALLALRYHKQDRAAKRQPTDA